MPIQAISELRQGQTAAVGSCQPTLEVYYDRLRESFFKLKNQVGSLDRLHFSLTAVYILKDDELASATPAAGSRPPYLELFSRLAARYEELAGDMQIMLDELHKHL